MAQQTIDVEKEFAKYAQLDGWLNDVEGRTLFSIAMRGQQSGHIVEIGSWKGKSSSYLALAAKLRGEKVVCIEHFFGDGKGREELLSTSPGKNSFSEFAYNLKNNDLYDNTIILAVDSTRAAEIWNKSIKMIFIDGEHSFKAVNNDFRLFERFVLVGGFVCFHDVDAEMKNEIATLIKQIASEGSYNFLGINGSVGILQKLK